MSEKKSLVGFLSWFLLLILVLGGLFFSLGNVLEANPEFVPLDPAIAVIPVFVAVVALVFLLSFLFGRLTKDHKIQQNAADSIVFQFGGFFVFLVLLDVAMIVFWLVGYTQNFQVTDIVNIDSVWVGAEGTFNAAITSATGWYHIILHSVFVLLGNKTELVFVVNMAFAALGLLFAYLGGRKLLGNTPVWFLTLGIGLSITAQECLHRADPTALLFALVMLLVWWIVGLNESSRKPDAKGILSVAILIGMLTGIGIYADGIFLIAAFTGIYLFLQPRDNGEKVGIALSALVPFFVGILFAVGCLVAANVPTVDSIADALPGWIHMPGTVVTIPEQLAIISQDSVCILGLALALLYVFQFTKARQDKGSILIFPWICMVACFLLGISFSEGSTFLYLVGYIWALAGIGLQIIFVEQDGEEHEAPVVSKPVKEKKEKPVKEKKAKKGKEEKPVDSKKEEKLLAKEEKKRAKEEAALQKKAALEEKKATAAEKKQKDKPGKESKEEKKLRRQQEAMEREAALEERKQQVLREREERKALKQGIPFVEDNTEIFDDFSGEKKKEDVIVSTEYDDLDDLLFAPVSKNGTIETVPTDAVENQQTPDISQILEMDPLDISLGAGAEKIETPREVPKEEPLTLQLSEEPLAIEVPKEEPLTLQLPEEPLSLELPEEESLSLQLSEEDALTLELPEEESDVSAVLEGDSLSEPISETEGEIAPSLTAEDSDVPVDAGEKIGSLNKPLKVNELPDFAEFLEFQEPYYVEEPEEKKVKFGKTDSLGTEPLQTDSELTMPEGEEEERDLDFTAEALVFDLHPKEDHEIEVFSADFIEELKAEEENPIIDIDDIDESLFGDTIPEKKPKQPEDPKGEKKAPSEEMYSEEIEYDYFEDIGEDFGVGEEESLGSDSSSYSARKSASQESLEEFDYSEDIGDYDFEDSTVYEAFESETRVEEEPTPAPDTISVGEEMDVDYEDFGMEDGEEVQVFTIDDVPEGIADTIDLPQPKVEHLNFEVKPSNLELKPSNLEPKPLNFEPEPSNPVPKPKQRANISDRIRKSRPMKTYDDF